MTSIPNRDRLSRDRWLALNVSIPVFLKWRRFDNPHQESGKSAIGFFQALHDLIHCFNVIELQPPAKGIDEEFLGEGAIKIQAMPGGKDMFQGLHVRERLAGQQLSG